MGTPPNLGPVWVSLVLVGPVWNERGAGHSSPDPGWGQRSGRRGRDSNPRWLWTTPLFESGTLNHSDTSPETP